MQRKSSLGRRSSTVSSFAYAPTAMSVLDSARPEERKSKLLMPGFSSKKRSVSEDRMSQVPPFLQSCSRSQTNLLEVYTPYTPKFLKNNALPTGSTRPTRSSIWSMESGRASSFGGVKCSAKKETRPIKDKDFQMESLRKVEEFFNNTKEGYEILEKSQKVRPITTKKFINMTDFLLQCLNDRINITKDNYIEELIKWTKRFMYNGTVEKSWLMTVNAQHAWYHVISLLVWLVDLVQLSNAMENFDPFPEPIEDELCEASDLLQRNFDIIFPSIAATYYNTINGKKTEKDIIEDFKREGESIKEKIFERDGLSQEAILALKDEYAELEKEWNSEQYMSDLAVVQNDERNYQTVLDDNMKLKEYNIKVKEYIESKENQIVSMNNEIEEAESKLKEQTVLLDKLKVDSEHLKKTLSDVSKESKESKEIQQELQRTIRMNEKFIEGVAEDVYKMDLQIAKILKQIEDVLVEYNKIIAVHTSKEQRLSSCALDGMHKATSAITEPMKDLEKQFNVIKEDWDRALKKSNAEVSRLDVECKQLKEELVDLEKVHNQIEDDIQSTKEEFSLHKTAANRAIKQCKDDLKSLKEYNKSKLKEKYELNLEIKKYEEENGKLSSRILEIENQVKEEIEFTKEIVETKKKMLAEFMAETQEKIQKTVDKVKEIKKRCMRE